VLNEVAENCRRYDDLCGQLFLTTWQLLHELDQSDSVGQENTLTLLKHLSPCYEEYLFDNNRIHDVSRMLKMGNTTAMKRNAIHIVWYLSFHENYKLTQCAFIEVLNLCFDDDNEIRRMSVSIIGNVSYHDKTTLAILTHNEQTNVMERWMSLCIQEANTDIKLNVVAVKLRARSVARLFASAFCFSKSRLSGFFATQTV
jgi:hypothetical protein